MTDHKIDLHAEVPISSLKVEITEGTREAYKKAFESPDRPTMQEMADSGAAKPAEMKGVSNPQGLSPEAMSRILSGGKISFDDFLKVDMRVGTIKTAERIPKSDKLLKLLVSFGPGGNRPIVATLAKSYAPEALIGVKVVAVLNLAARKIMGIESEGMILATSGPSGTVLLYCSGDDGAKVG
jgi:methionine--tRNA ligase beta chain